MKDKLSIWWKFCLLTLLLVLAPPEIMAQGLTIKGQVLDSNNEPIIGASIVEKGNTSNGTITDFDGNFSFKISGKGKTIVITYIGYQTQELTVTSGKALKVIMKEDAQAMDEVVVIGYTSKARKDLTGSVGSVSGVKIAAIPVSSAAVALQGKIAGVQVTTVDGAPGADINIRVRGGTSVTQSNEPLYIVDGFQVDNINDIPPTDIASIDVLKDASITAIYGAKGGNGVVVVTTKSAKAGKIQVSLNAHLSTSQLAKKLDLMNAAEFARYQYEWSACNGSRSSNAKFFRANFGNPQDLDMYNTLPTHDWQDEVMGENPINYSTNVSIGGGTEKMRFNASLTQSEDKGIIMGSGVRRTNLNIKTAIDITKNLTLQINPKLSFRRDEGAGGDNIGTGGIIDVLRYRPTNGLREFGYIDPSYADPDEEALFTYTNPKSDISINQQKKYSYNYTNAFSLEWKPIKGLVLRSEATIGLTWKDQYRFYGALTSEGQKNNSQPVANIQKDYTFKYIWTNTASYGFTLKNVHNISLLLGQEIYHSQNTKNVQKNRYFPRAFEADQAWANMGFGTPQESYTQLSTPDRTASFFGQASYNYNHKYLLSLTMRADGSAKFAKGNRWGYFPSAAVAWRIMDEDFMEGSRDWLSNLKLRLSYGTAGNNRIGSGLMYTTYSMAAATSKGPYFDEKFNSMLEHGSTLSNPGLKWETTITRNLGFDFGFLNNRISGSIDAYWNSTKDLLMKTEIPSNTGYSYQYQNFGKTSNKGVELQMNAILVQNKNFNLDFNFNIAWNKNRIDELPIDNPWQSSNWSGSTISKYEDYRVEKGGSLGEIWGFKTNGYYTAYDAVNNPNGELVWGSGGWQLRDGIKDNSTTITGGKYYPGGLKVECDENGDPIKQKLGNTIAPINGGFGISGNWKNFDFTAFFNYSIGNKIINGTKLATAFRAGSALGYNLNSDFDLSNRYTWIDPANGLNIGNPSNSTINTYGSIDNVITRLNELNQGANMYHPAAVTTMQLIDYAVENASFLRVNNISIGYTLPKQIVKKAWIENVRIYLTGYNLFCFTKYSGADPEVDTSSKKNAMCPGVDYAAYPKSRSFVGGINVTF